MWIVLVVILFAIAYGLVYLTRKLVGEVRWAKAMKFRRR